MLPESNIPIKYKSDATIDGFAPVIIIGPNGSGKTRYGRQVESWNKSEFIPALRNIELPEDIPMRTTRKAEAEIAGHKLTQKRSPWRQSNEINYLFSKLIAEDSASAMRFRDVHHTDKTATPEVTKLMRLRGVWMALFPGRTIKFEGYVPMVASEHVEGGAEYSAQKMSDGERVALYLAGRVLDSKSTILIIDEPEVHFHSRLAARFWDEMEALRSDTRFVYITHDLPFALSRHTDTFIIVKPDQEPKLASLSDGLPLDLAQSILAAASISIFATRIVFCEGTESSFDQKFYSAWFHNRDTAVVPVGSCRDVIRCTRTFQDEGLVSGVSPTGVIDSDYWPDAFLDSVPAGLHVAPVHEIESLFCLRSVFLAVASHLGHDEVTSNRRYDESLVEARARFRGGLLVMECPRKLIHFL
jgi:energy-coupling factor transporter ATP-binding protein EcfA2